jgi:hypothetical protein
MGYRHWVSCHTLDEVGPWVPHLSLTGRHLHLHVISEDRIAPALKTKKHYNSFRPDLGFFVPLMEVQRWLQQDEATLRERVDVGSQLVTVY